MERKSLRFTGADGNEMALDMATGAMYRVQKKMLVDKLMEFDNIKFIWDKERMQVKAVYENAVIKDGDKISYIFGIGKTANEAVREMLNDMKGEVVLKNKVTYQVDDEGNFIEVVAVNIA